MVSTRTMPTTGEPPDISSQRGDGAIGIVASAATTSPPWISACVRSDATRRRACAYR